MLQFESPALTGRLGEMGISSNNYKQTIGPNGAALRVNFDYRCVPYTLRFCSPVPLCIDNGHFLIFSRSFLQCVVCQRQHPQGLAYRIERRWGFIKPERRIDRNEG